MENRVEADQNLCPIHDGNQLAGTRTRDQRGEIFYGLLQRDFCHDRNLQLSPRYGNAMC